MLKYIVSYLSYKTYVQISTQSDHEYISYIALDSAACTLVDSILTVNIPLGFFCWVCKYAQHVHLLSEFEFAFEFEFELCHLGALCTWIAVAKAALLLTCCRQAKKQQQPQQQQQQQCRVALAVDVGRW